MDSIKTFPKFTVFFLALMALEIAGLTVIPTFHIVSKALIMAGLIGFYITTEKRQNNSFLTGLIFALLGDCFLLFETAEFFVIGLSCFLIMQLLYASAFNRKRRIPKNKDFLVSGGIAIFGGITLTYLWPNLGSMKVAVSLYVFAIVSMAIFAYLRHPRLRGYKIVLLGVVLFLISDILLGINRFGLEIKYGQIFVMVTYMLAQYLIVTGEVLSGMPRQKEKIKSTSNFGRHKV